MRSDSRVGHWRRILQGKGAGSPSEVTVLESGSESPSPLHAPQLIAVTAVCGASVHDIQGGLQPVVAELMNGIRPVWFIIFILTMFASWARGPCSHFQTPNKEKERRRKKVNGYCIFKVKFHISVLL